MGRPAHYSSEVPARCQALIEMLGRKVEEESDPDGRWGGPLKTTFLLAMATPMVVLPVERLFKPVVLGRSGVANEKSLDLVLDERMSDELGQGRAFETVSFYRPGAWSCAPSVPPFEVSGAWPREALRELTVPAALEAAAGMEAGKFLTALRNSLAHGGVTYLDENGEHTNSATHMLGFASITRQHGETSLLLLRISVPDFEEFLRLWSRWLSSSGVSQRLRDEGPGYFEIAAE